jgi:DNA helicase-2/ATP-dependent DNA helicase PcrA
MLSACPGSGKTRVIVSKLSRVLDEVRDTPRAVACITYTNAAVNEIEARLRTHMQPGDDAYYHICTIHSFCLNHVFRPFCHLIEGYGDGFKLLTPESPEFVKHVTVVCAAHGRHNLVFKDFEEFTQLRIDIDGEPVGQGLERGALTKDTAIAYWDRIRKAGFIDFSNIIYYSLCLLRDRSEILDYVSAKFAWILVDEFQDTTDVQVEILSLIAGRKRTRFFLVGDPHQSIFRFAGARPDLADEFAARISARTDMQLSGNFRSSAPIVEHANRLFARDPEMTAIGDARKYTETPERVHGQSAFEVITEFFLPALETLGIPIGDAAVLAPSWYALYPLGRKLREYGISIVGPGARPYRKSSQFAPLAEQICGYVVDGRPAAIPAIERSLFNTVLDITGRAHFDIFSYSGRLTVFRLIRSGQDLATKYEGGVRWLEEAAKEFADLLREAGYFSREDRMFFTTSVNEMKTDMEKNSVDLANLTIDELGVYASTDTALKLSTFHNAKGREYSAVAMIDLHEGKIPSSYDRTPDEVQEAKRKFYVGVTRAKRFLVYVTDDTYGRHRAPTRFLGADGVGVS